MIVEYDWGCNRLKAWWPAQFFPGLGWSGGSAVFVTPTLHGGALLGDTGAAPKVQYLGGFPTMGVPHDGWFIMESSIRNG